MARYIDADKAIAMFKEAQQKTDNIIEITSLIGSMAVIDSCQTEDVAPVVHAHWEWHEEWLPSTTEYPAECQVAEWRCSNCKTLLSDEVDGYWDDIENPPKLKYCPHCGAKMDAESYSEETIENCSLIKMAEAKGEGKPNIFIDTYKCEGYQKSEINDEPCEKCKECKYYAYADEEEE